MDVLAMRKSSGEIHGEVRLNGHLQEENSFRRSTGYVVQFDTQSPQLTIRETCEFSAKLRLDETDSAVTPESISKFVDQTLEMLELSVFQDLQVGSDEGGGLSFEQRKRLSIAVELVANPSILFLDEVRHIPYCALFVHHFVLTHVTCITCSHVLSQLAGSMHELLLL
jgi:ABC-type multidrug transport system ATPase subunit